jgi:hypothetical protein
MAPRSCFFEPIEFKEKLAAIIPVACVPLDRSYRRPSCSAGPVEAG